MSCMTDMGAYQDALGDYYDSGAIGDPPKREDFASHHPTEVQP